MKVYIYDKVAIAKKLDDFIEKKKIRNVRMLANTFKVGEGFMKKLYIGECKAINEDGLEHLAVKLGLVPNVDYMEVEPYSYQHLNCTLVCGDVVNNSSAHDNYIRFFQRKQVEERRVVKVKNDVIHQTFNKFKFIKVYPHHNLWEYQGFNGPIKCCFPHGEAPSKFWEKGGV